MSTRQPVYDPIALCPRCLREYIVDDNYGTLGCRVHVAPFDPMTLRYPCCGVSLVGADQRRMPVTHTADDFLGCRRADHQVAPMSGQLTDFVAVIPEHRSAARKAHKAGTVVATVRDADALNAALRAVGLEPAPPPVTGPDFAQQVARDLGATRY